MRDELTGMSMKNNGDRNERLRRNRKPIFSCCALTKNKNKNKEKNKNSETEVILPGSYKKKCTLHDKCTIFSNFYYCF